MQPISIRITQDKFIVSIDKQWVDGEAFARFIEKLKIKILAKENNLDETLKQLTPKEPYQTARYSAAQQFKSSAKCAHLTSKYDVCEQYKIFLDSSILVEYVKGAKTDLLYYLLNDASYTLFISQIVVNEFYFHALAIDLWYAQRQ